MSPSRDHLVSIGSRVDITPLRSSGGRISGASDSPCALPAGVGPEKAAMMRPVRVCGLLLPFPAVGDMTISGYRGRRSTPNHPEAAFDRDLAGYGCGPADPPGRLAQLVRAQPSHG